MFRFFLFCSLFTNSLLKMDTMDQMIGTPSGAIAAMLQEKASPRRAKECRRFFKTGPGEYGEGDLFLGLSNPQVREIVRLVWKECPMSEAAELIRSPWHEVRLCGLLILVEKMTRASKDGDREQTDAIYRLYTSLHPHINNWDLVDLSATRIVGIHELECPEDHTMDGWIRLPDESLWQRRISMVGTWLSIHKGLFGSALERASVLTGSREPLLHKAAGWMLREVGKNGGEMELEDFLERHISRIPAVMLSYACEKMDPAQRRKWQQARRTGNLKSVQ